MKLTDWVLAALCASWLLLALWIGAPQNAFLQSLWTEATAAWAQAIGSVAAIVALFVAQRRDHQHQQSRDEARDAAELSEIAVVLGEAYRLGERLTLLLPLSPNHRKERTIDFRRDEDQWRLTVEAVERLPPKIARQYTAQLIVRARLNRAFQIYRQALGNELEVDDLLDFDLSVGRLQREIVGLGPDFKMRGVNAPINRSDEEHNISELRSCARLMSANLQLLVRAAGRRPGWQKSQGETFTQLTKRRTRQLARLIETLPSDERQLAARQLMRRAVQMENFVAHCIEEDVDDRPGRRSIVFLESQILGVIDIVRRIEGPDDPGR